MLKRFSDRHPYIFKEMSANISKSSFLRTWHFWRNSVAIIQANLHWILLGEPFMTGTCQGSLLGAQFASKTWSKVTCNDCNIFKHVKYMYLSTPQSRPIYIYHIITAFIHTLFMNVYIMDHPNSNVYVYTHAMWHVWKKTMARPCFLQSPEYWDLASNSKLADFWFVDGDGFLVTFSYCNLLYLTQQLHHWNIFMETYLWKHIHELRELKDF